MDLSDLIPSLSGKYIISFIDIYKGSPEGFPVPDKSAANIVQLLIDEIIPRQLSIDPVKKSRLVVPPESTESEMEVDNEENETVENRTLILKSVNQKNKHERDTSSDEDEIPLKELKKRINIYIKLDSAYLVQPGEGGEKVMNFAAKYDKQSGASGVGKDRGRSCYQQMCSLFTNAGQPQG
ncbi:unnamed protein product [Mytilus coruscus]|uniref:Uncharacterized protein n=1 Tax=Mytilus coruscus TaxID=42192 RepID=A0A6J8DRP8_MYTCO|nr:unnamed protein product [Mytilus coruscus]